MRLAKMSTLWSEPQRANLTRHGHNIVPGYLEWNSNRAKDMALPAKDDFVQPACPLLERILTKFELLRRELEIERRKNSNQDSSYPAELGQYKYFLKIQRQGQRQKERTRTVARRLQRTRFEE